MRRTCKSTREQKHRQSRAAKTSPKVLPLYNIQIIDSTNKVLKNTTKIAPKTVEIDFFTYSLIGFLILLFNLFSANCDNLKIKYAKKALNIRGNKDTKGF